MHHRRRLRVEELEARLVPVTNSAPIAQTFLSSLYDNVLQHSVDPAGSSFWEGSMNQGAGFQQVALGVAGSQEAQALQVGSLYHWYLGRAAGADGLGFWLNTSNAGTTVEQVKAGLLGSPEYFLRHGGTADGFLAGLYQDVLDRGVDPLGQAFFGAQLAAGAARSDVALQVVTSAESLGRIVQGDYLTFLHHSGSDAGVQFWVGRMQAGDSDAQVMASFACSDECLLKLATPQPDVVLSWESTLLDALRTGNTAPPQASRAIAILSASVYDAVDLIEPSHPLYNPGGVIAGLPGTALPGTSREAAAAQAAYTVLVNLFPAQKAGFDHQLAASLAGIADGTAKTDGVALGTAVANAVLAWRSGDGASRVVAYTPGSGPGVWQPTPPAFAPALDPQWAQLTPFTMASDAQFRPPGPPAVGSAAFAADFNETKDLGAANSTTRTPVQTMIALFWADGGGTETPPGHWVDIARQVSLAQAESLGDNARLFALLGLTLADAAIVAWDAKFTYNSWRPIAAITSITAADNPAVTADPSWKPLLPTPPFPEYVSGHSTFSGAAAAVLTSFFGAGVGFTSASDGLSGVQRTFTDFNSAANEAGESRIYGGIHFESANQDGLAAGRALGAYVVQKFLT